MTDTTTLDKKEAALVAAFRKMAPRDQFKLLKQAMGKS